MTKLCSAYFKREKKIACRKSGRLGLEKVKCYQGSDSYSHPCAQISAKKVIGHYFFETKGWYQHGNQTQPSHIFGVLIPA